MKLRYRLRLPRLSRILMTVACGIALAPALSGAAEVKILTSRPMNPVLSDLAEPFQRASGHKIRVILAAPTEIMRRIGSNEMVDVVMSSDVTLDKLVQQGKVAPGDRLVLARVGIGLAVRAGAVKPDISSTEALKHTLLAAKSIVYTDPASGGRSGIHFDKVLDRLGIAKEVKAKSILNAQPATKPSAEYVARGEAELGIQLISEIVTVQGAELLGPLPAELQDITLIVAGILKTAHEPDAAKALFKHLSSPEAAAAIKAAGMEPGGL
jgi:molybdate transport system substrate-binding protein